MALTAEQVAGILRQAGWQGEDLVTILAIGKRESEYNPTVHRGGTNSGDYGLFQINAVNLGFLQNAIGITSMNDLLDPLTNAKAAMALYQNSGWKPWAAGTGGFTPGGSHLYGTNVEAARQAANNSGGAMPADTAAVTPTGTFKLPSDAQVYNPAGTSDLFAVFDLGGFLISYKIPPNGAVDYSDKQPQVVDPGAWASMNAVDGGSAEELGSTSVTFGSYKAFWDSILAQVMGFNNPAKDDPEVRRVLAEFAARPDMAPAELQNRLEATSWWKGKTTSELEWNGLADGEKQKRRDDMAAKMAQTWTQFTGEPVDASDPRISNYLENVSSGKMGYGAWTEQVVKRAAKDIQNSPYNRDIADEAKAKKQPGIDVENTAMRIRQLNSRWGVQWSEGTIQDWARKIVNKDSSDDDLLEELKTQAQAKYAWKPRDMETASAAAPWVETMNRVMETNADLSHPDVQKALTLATPVWQFEQDLKKSGKWLSTKNARSELTTMAGSVGKMLGY